jgi:acyl dehydratase
MSRVGAELAGAPLLGGDGRIVKPLPVGDRVRAFV